MSVRIDLTIVVGDDIAVDVRGDVTEANEKAIAFRIVECEAHPELVGTHHVVQGPTLSQVLRAKGYAHRRGHPGTQDILDANTGEVVLPNARWHEAWKWLTSYDALKEAV